MKVITFLLLTFSTLTAAYVGNPSSPAILYQGGVFPCDYMFSLRAGYVGDFIFDANMEKKGSTRVDRFYQDFQCGQVTVTFKEKAEAYVLLGQGQIEANWRISPPAPNIKSLIEIDSRYGFTYGAGAKVILYQYCDLTLGAGGKYIQVDPRLNRLTSNGELLDVNTDICFESFQVDLCLSYNIDFFIPYIGSKYLRSWSKLKADNLIIADDGSDSLHMENRNQFGFIIGCTLSTGCQVMASVEARLFDEEAISISGCFRF